MSINITLDKKQCDLLITILQRSVAIFGIDAHKPLWELHYSIVNQIYSKCENYHKNNEELLNDKWFDPIEDLEFTVRTTNCLISQEIFYVGQLIQKHPSELSYIPNLGRRSLREIEETLTRIGLSLNTKIDNFEEKLGKYLSLKKERNNA